jgi:hypothetical protein
MPDESNQDPATTGSVEVEDADGAANEIGGRSGREARLDLILAEELATDEAFVRWFLAEAGTGMQRPTPPAEAPHESLVRLNVDEHYPDVPVDAEGETDVEVVLHWQGESLPVLVEDKIWAPFQHRQPERYVLRAEHRGGVAVLVAPEAYLATHAARAEVFHGQVSIEAIIQRLRDEAASQIGSDLRRRKLWRAQLLTELIRKPEVIEDEPTVQFTQYCVDWFAANAPSVVVSERSLHTAGQGWLWFEVPRGLGYKAVGWSKKPTAAVDLYLKDHGFTGTAEELSRLLDEVGLPEGFVLAHDTAKVPNVVLRFECAKVNPMDGPPEPASPRERDVLRALEACRRAADWIHQHQARLTHIDGSGAGR